VLQSPRTPGGGTGVNSAGTPTFLANVHAFLEGVTTVPNDPVRYGPLAGKIRAPATPLRTSTEPSVIGPATAEGRAQTAIGVEVNAVGQFRRRFPPGMCSKVRRAE